MLTFTSYTPIFDYFTFYIIFLIFCHSIEYFRHRINKSNEMDILIIALLIKLLLSKKILVFWGY